jgi:hypothetical protein
VAALAHAMHEAAELDRSGVRRAAELRLDKSRMVDGYERLYAEMTGRGSDARIGTAA